MGSSGLGNDVFRSPELWNTSDADYAIYSAKPV